MERFVQKYKKIRAIGQGAFGKVFLVENRDEGTLAVVKVVSSQSMAQDYLNEFVSEVAIMAKLQHPHVVRLLDHVIFKTSICIVMQYAEEGNLDDKIKSRKGLTFPRNDYCKWIAQLLSAITHVHSNGIMHRDLKSQNVFIMKGGDVVIGDFGVSKQVSLAETTVGTPYYQAPEILQGKPYSTKADIWALGVVFYEIVTLRLPFTSPSFSLPALILRVVRGSYPDIPQSIDGGIRKLISAMLTVNPSQRPVAILSFLLYNPLSRCWKVNQMDIQQSEGTVDSHFRGERTFILLGLS